MSSSSFPSKQNLPSDTNDNTNNRKNNRGKRLVQPSINRPIYSARIATFLLALLVITAFRYNQNRLLSSNDNNTKDDDEHAHRPDPFASHPYWLLASHNWHWYLLTMTATSFMFYISFITEPSFLTIRAIWTTISGLLLLKKVYDFYQFARLLYLFDFCYYANACFTIALWNVPVGDNGTRSKKKHLKGDSSKHDDDKFPEYAKAVFCVMNGPVAGGTFMLGTALIFHHLDAFSSFWLHVVPMWITYSMRWHKYPRLLAAKYPHLHVSLVDWRKRDTFWSGVRMLYLPWVVLHALFLILHPYTPFAKYETLYDWVMYGGVPTSRDTSFWLWTGQVVGYCVAHFILSAQGLLAAALAFKYQLVHVVWICCVLINCVYSGYTFYENTINPPSGGNNGDAPSAFQGLQRCAMAWIFAIAPAYWYCRTYPEHTTIQKADIAKRKSESKKIRSYPD